MVTIRKDIAQREPIGPDLDEVTIHTSSLFDSKHKTFLTNITLTIDTKSGLITSSHQRDHDLLPAHNVSNSHTVDLRGLTVLPGLVDAHTHIFLHPYAETSSTHQMRDESLVERVVRATNHVRSALEAGYTTYRDLGTEGLRDADVHFRDAVNRGIIPGPRLFVATECIASSGGYEVRMENTLPGGIGATAPRISDPADGVYGVRAAVRRRLGAGADVIKFYADYRKRALRFPEDGWPGQCPVQFPPSGDLLYGDRNPNVLLFTQEEMDAMVDEAKRSHAPICAHAQSPEAVVMAARAGVTSIEHGAWPSEEALQAMKENDTIFVPTLSVFDLYLSDGSGEAARARKAILGHTKAAFEKGIKIACGGDTGAFAHGDNARELELLVEAGVPVLDVLQGATLTGWESCGGDLCGRRFGFLGPGWAADIVAFEGDASEDVEVLRRPPVFVMKDGRVYKQP
ncbi:isoaspartyl dipeptidase-like protein [Coniochaeta sp. 2T2.1]|nr:isoaspartyl dipeptidase-like protein [Coniochaeta sp. 2T2.1]